MFQNQKNRATRKPKRGPRSKKGGFHFEKYPILVLDGFSAFRSFVLRRPLTGGSDALPRVGGEEQKTVLFSQQALKCTMHLITTRLRTNQECRESLHFWRSSWVPPPAFGLHEVQMQLAVARGRQSARSIGFQTSAQLNRTLQTAPQERALGCDGGTSSGACFCLESTRGAPDSIGGLFGEDHLRGG